MYLLTHLQKLVVEIRWSDRTIRSTAFSKENVRLIVIVGQHKENGRKVLMSALPSTRRYLEA